MLFREPTGPGMHRGAGTGLHVIACGAIARELVTVCQIDRLPNVSIACLPPDLHNHPDRIADLVRQHIRSARPRAADILVGYADCGTGGGLDAVCQEEGVTRLPGAHCYELFAGARAFAEFQEAEPGTFYLTDYLVRNFDRLIIQGLGLDRFPELRGDYFGNYRRLVHLAQTHDPHLADRAESAAQRLELDHQYRYTGLDGLHASLRRAVAPDAEPAKDVKNLLEGAA